MKCLHSRGKSKAVIPEVPASSGVQFTNVGETVDEEATLSPSKSLPVSKFRTKRNYFEGEGHSLKATKSEPARPSRPSGFRREESNSRSVATLPESRFTQKDKEEHFKRAQVVLEIRCLFDYPVDRLLGKPEYSTHSFLIQWLLFVLHLLCLLLSLPKRREWRLSF